jgi:hypothetical protein
VAQDDIESDRRSNSGTGRRRALVDADGKRIRVAHVCTIDLSLRYLLANQMRHLQRAGYDVIGISAPGPHVEWLEANGIRHVSVEMKRAFTPLHRRIEDDIAAVEHEIGPCRVDMLGDAVKIFGQRWEVRGRDGCRRSGSVEIRPWHDVLLARG